MRLSPRELQALRAIIGELDPGGCLYLYDSLADDTRRGGDIDVYLQASRPMGQRGLLRTQETRSQCARGLEHKQKRAWAMALEQNASAEFGAACKVVSSNWVARTDKGQGGMSTTKFHGTAGYVTRVSGGAGGKEGPQGFFLSRLIPSGISNVQV